MTDEIRITDLQRPVLNKAQEAALAYGESVRVEFTQEAVLGAACKRTGLSDFGSLDFLPRLNLLLDEWGSDDAITGLGRLTLNGYLVRYAANRLLIHDTLKRHP